MEFLLPQMFLQALDSQIVSPRAEFIREEVFLFQQLKFQLKGKEIKVELEHTQGRSPAP